MSGSEWMQGQFNAALLYLPVLWIVLIIAGALFVGGTYLADWWDEHQWRKGRSR